MPGERKILHIDMDCFYAAIEVRDHPEIAGKPVAVGGSSGRGVLTTCNYEAREFGCRSAMPTFKAQRLCPDLIMMPVRFDVYRKESARIRRIFAQFTELIEPLSLDEAYLDVSESNTSGVVIAKEIRKRIKSATGLSASAGIATNKLVAKIASDWEKPDGQFEVREDGIDAFMRQLPVRKIWGVGGVTAKRLAAMGVETCEDLWKLPKHSLAQELGRFGVELYDRSRGIDTREVTPHRERKSLSNERTYREDVAHVSIGQQKLGPLLDELEEDLRGAKHADRVLHKAFVKLKFADFTQTTIERAMPQVDRGLYHQLLDEAWIRGNGRAVRLIGAGVRFRPEIDGAGDGGQMELL